MAKKAKKDSRYMTRRGRQYLVERKEDGTFGKFIPQDNGKKTEVKKTKANKKEAKASEV